MNSIKVKYKMDIKPINSEISKISDIHWLLPGFQIR